LISKRELTAFQLAGNKKFSRRIAHQIADRVYERVTGAKGYFNTQVAFVSWAQSTGSPKFSLMVMDQDGWNRRPLKSIDAHLIKAPHFSPKGDKIVYIANRNRLRPQAFIWDIHNQSERILPITGNVFSARFTYDSQAVLVSHTDPKGRSVIARVGLGGEQQELFRREGGKHVYTSGSPDGQKVVFVSNLPGRAQLYQMSMGGGVENRLSREGGAYRTCSWSPLGEWIVSIKQDRGFYLALVHAQTGEEKLLASYYLVDSPVFAPGGSSIFFSAKETASSKQQLYVIDVASLKVRKIITPEEAGEPTCALLH